MWAQTILRFYARNLCTLSETKTIFADTVATCEISKQIYYDYILGLESLMIIDDVFAWCPSIRSRTSLRASKKRNFVVPFIVLASLGISPNYFLSDYKILGFLFESLCIRDLKIYSSVNNGVISYYRDRHNLKADAALHLDDGRYALIEFKLGQSEVDEGGYHLCEIEKLIKEHNKNEKTMSFKITRFKNCYYRNLV